MSEPTKLQFSLFDCDLINKPKSGGPNTSFYNLDLISKPKKREPMEFPVQYFSPLCDRCNKNDLGCICTKKELEAYYKEHAEQVQKLFKDIQEQTSKYQWKGKHATEEEEEEEEENYTIMIRKIKQLSFQGVDGKHPIAYHPCNWGKTFGENICFWGKRKRKKTLEAKDSADGRSQPGPKPEPQQCPDKKGDRDPVSKPMKRGPRSWRRKNCN